MKYQKCLSPLKISLKFQFYEFGRRLKLSGASPSIPNTNPNPNPNPPSHHQKKKKEDISLKKKAKLDESLKQYGPILLFIAEEYSMINEVKQKQQAAQKSFAQPNSATIRRNATANQIFSSFVPDGVFDHIAQQTTMMIRKKVNN